MCQKKPMADIHEPLSTFSALIIIRFTAGLQSHSGIYNPGSTAQVLMTSGKPGDWDKWVGLWVSLIQAVQARPATSRGSAIIDYIVVDIMNEPEASNFWLNGKGPYTIDLR